MAADSLTVQISPALGKALGLAAQEAVDYFVLVGVAGSSPDAKAIDQGVMERSKQLRKWQSSPQYRDEVVRLLSMVHRAAKILKDPLRCKAYLKELDRARRGEEASAVEEFTNLVRAALADAQLGPEARQELTRYAHEHGIDAAQAQSILASVNAELAAQRKAAAAAAKEEEWEFRIAGEGAEGFSFMLASMEANEQFTSETVTKLLAEAGRYGLSPEQAGKMIREFQVERFRKMIKTVAGEGLISEAQMRLLLPKAASFGLEQAEAYEIIADYSLSVRAPDDLMRELALAETFAQDEISEIVSAKAGQNLRRSWTTVLRLYIPDWFRNLVLIALGGGALVLGGLWLSSQMGSTSKTSGVIGPQKTPATGATATPVATISQSTPAPATGGAEGNYVARPDPASGMIAFKPEREGDPPAFEMAICEVTCAEYKPFLDQTLEPPPPGWTVGNRFPAGADQLPVTQVGWDQAMKYCRWLAGVKGWPADSVRLPTSAEYLRALRGRTTRGDPTQADYWSRARFNQARGIQSAKQGQFDKIFIPGSAQMYDLVGNVAGVGFRRKGRHAPRFLAAILNRKMRSSVTSWSGGFLRRLSRAR